MPGKRKKTQNVQAGTKRKTKSDHYHIWAYMEERQLQRLIDENNELKYPELSPEDYDVEPLSGESSTEAHLYLLKKIDDKTATWVLKVIPSACNRAEAEAQWRAGREKIGRRNSNAVVAVRLVDIWNYQGQCVQLLEFFSEGTLGDLLYKVELTSEVCFQLARQLNDLVVYLQQAGVVHGDLHPFNVAVVQKSPEYQLRLFDFDSSRIMVEDENFESYADMDYRNLLCNLIPEYQAKEGVVSQKYSSKQAQFNSNAALLVRALQKLRSVNTEAPGFFFETILLMNQYRNETEQSLMGGWVALQEGNQNRVCYEGELKKMKEMYFLHDTNEYDKYRCRKSKHLL